MSRYLDLASSKAGREWLAAHHECQSAHALANAVRSIEDILCDESIDPTRRKELSARITRMWQAWMGVDPSSLADRRRALVFALESACGLRRHQEAEDCVWKPGEVAVARMALDGHLGRDGVDVDDALLQSAIDAWASRPKRWRPILDLAVALRAVDAATTPENLRTAIARITP